MGNFFGRLMSGKRAALSSSLISARIWASRARYLALVFGVRAVKCLRRTSSSSFSFRSILRVADYAVVQRFIYTDERIRRDKLRFQVRQWTHPAILP